MGVAVLHTELLSWHCNRHLNASVEMSPWLLQASEDGPARQREGCDWQPVLAAMALSPKQQRAAVDARLALGEYKQSTKSWQHADAARGGSELFVPPFAHSCRHLLSCAHLRRQCIALMVAYHMW